jgi:hypothetical protein
METLLFLLFARFFATFIAFLLRHRCTKARSHSMPACPPGNESGMPADRTRRRDLRALRQLLHLLRLLRLLCQLTIRRFQRPEYSSRRRSKKLFLTKRPLSLRSRARARRRPGPRVEAPRRGSRPGQAKSVTRTKRMPSCCDCVMTLNRRNGRRALVRCREGIRGRFARVSRGG